MSRKDYIVVARILKHAKHFDDDPETTRQYIRDQLALMFEQDNPNFDVDRFMEACE